MPLQRAIAASILCKYLTYRQLERNSGAKWRDNSRVTFRIFTLIPFCKGTLITDKTGISTGFAQIYILPWNYCLGIFLILKF